MMQIKLAALFGAILALSGTVSAAGWSPVKPIFDIHFSMWEDDNCDLPEGNTLAPMNGAAAAMRDGLCVSYHEGKHFNSFAYGHRLETGKKAYKKLHKQELKYPVCQLEIYDQPRCGGTPHHYLHGENSTEAAQLPGFPIYVVHDATGSLNQNPDDRLRRCNTLKNVARKGQSALMTCEYVTANELPDCKKKSVQDDWEEKGLIRPCYKREAHPKEQHTIYLEDWCRPNCRLGSPFEKTS